jgi:hypothetical protein
MSGSPCCVRVSGMGVSGVVGSTRGLDLGGGFDSTGFGVATAETGH